MPLNVSHFSFGDSGCIPRLARDSLVDDRPHTALVQLRTVIWAAEKARREQEMANSGECASALPVDG